MLATFAVKRRGKWISKRPEAKPSMIRRALRGDQGRHLPEVVAGGGQKV